MEEVEQRMRHIGDEVGNAALPVEGSPAAERLRRWVVHTLVSETIVRCEARFRGIIDQSTERVVLARPLDADVAAAVFAAVTAHVDIDERDTHRYWRANADRYRRGESRRVRHAVVGDAGVAAALAARAAAGAEVGMDDMDDMEVRRGRFAGELDDAIFAASSGDVVGPIRTELGWHVARVERIVPAAVTPLADVRADIRADLLAAARGREFDGWLAARKAATTRVAPGYEHPADPRSTVHMHRH